MSKEKKSDVVDITKEIESVSQECKVEELPDIREWCPTGCTLLDLAIADKFPGGVPIGRIVQMYGASSTCKSVFGTTVLGYAQRRGMETYLADIENAFSPIFASEKLGLNLKSGDFYLGYSWDKDKTPEDEPHTVEEFFDEYLKGILARKTKKPRVIVIDSITALPAEAEIKKEMTDSGFGAVRAKQIGLGLRKYNRALADSQTTLICIDQARDNLKSMWGGEITTGGRGLEYYAQVRIYLKHADEVLNSEKKKIGIWTKFVIKKNREAPPLREGKFKLLWDYGLDDIESNLIFLSESQNGIKEAEKAGTTIELFGDKKTLKSWIACIEEGGLEKKLQEEVVTLWRKQYAPEPRKTRVW